jgi:hypothetical protein
MKASNLTEYKVGVAYSGITFIPNFVRIGQLVQRSLKVGGGGAVKNILHVDLIHLQVRWVKN